MNFVDSIIKKRDGGKLTKEEIAFFVKGVTDGISARLSDFRIADGNFSEGHGYGGNGTADHGNGTFGRYV